jgi:hypothetical protein
MLEWAAPDENGVLRAYDDKALYVIFSTPSGYRVGFFPAPGPECPWSGPHATLDEAKASAEACVANVIAPHKQGRG